MNPPNYNSSTPLSAWWLENTPQGKVVWGTTGHDFIVLLQTALAQHFSGRDFAAFGNSYQGGSINADGNWGPVTNAALWAWLGDKRADDPSFADGIGNIADAVAQGGNARQINALGLFAAIWAAHYGDQTFSGVGSILELADAPNLNLIVYPPYDHPAPPRSHGMDWCTWPATGQPPANCTQGSADAGTGIDVIGRVSRALTSPRRLLGLTGFQWGLAGLFVAGVGTVAYFATKDDEKRHDLPHHTGRAAKAASHHARA